MVMFVTPASLMKLIINCGVMIMLISVMNNNNNFRMFWFSLMTKTLNNTLVNV